MWAIENITPGDDYAAMEQALRRRYREAQSPDILFIDGGVGQVKVAERVLSELNWKKLMGLVLNGDELYSIILAECRVSYERAWTI